MNITEIKMRKKANHGRLKAVVLSIIVGVVVLTISLVILYVKYNLYLEKLGHEVVLYKQQIVQYQEKLQDSNNSEDKFFEIIDGIQVKKIPVFCISKGNIFFEVIPTSKLLMEKDSCNYSEETVYYEKLFSEYILKSNHLNNMNFNSYLNYRLFTTFNGKSKFPNSIT